MSVAYYQSWIHFLGHFWGLVRQLLWEQATQNRVVLADIGSRASSRSTSSLPLGQGFIDTAGDSTIFNAC